MPVPASLTGNVLWIRGKDQAGVNGSTVTAITDQSGGTHDPDAISGVTVATAATPSSGKAFRLTNGQISLPPGIGLIAYTVTATASSEFSTNYTARNANDGSTTTEWVASGTSVPQWLRYQLASAQTITEYSLRVGGSGRPTSWTVEGSNDGTSWTTLDTQSSITWGTNPQTFSFTNTTAYLYYRLNVSVKGDAFEVRVAEWNLTGVGTATHGPGEMWVVVKSNTTSGSAWGFGTSGSQSHFTFSGTVYTDFGNTVRRSYTPTVTVAATWRLLRTYIDGSGNVAEYLDNALQLSASGATKSWRPHPLLLEAWTGDVAEVLIRNTVSTSGEVADLILYFNTEHGMSVPGGTVPNTHNGDAALTSTSVLTASPYIGSPTGGAGANLTAASTLTAAVVISRTVAASLTSLSQLTASGNADLLVAEASLTSVSTLTATPLPPVATEASATMWAAAALFVEATNGTAAAAALTAGSTLTVAATAFKPFVEPNDPRTGRPQWRIITAGRDGTRYGEITNATTSPIEDGVGVGATFGLTTPTADPKLADATAPGRQLQAWRGTHLEFRGPVVTARADDNGTTTTLQCRDPFWYLESGRRVIGRVPKRDLLVNGSFATGEPPWFGSFEPTSIPPAAPTRSVVDVDFFGLRMKALQISGVDKVVTFSKEVKTEAVFAPNSSAYLSGGEAAIKAVAQLMPKTGTLQVRVDGYTADNRINGDPGDGMELSRDRADAAKATILSVRPGASITTAGHGYYFQIPGGLAANRRVVISWTGVQEASGHKQYEAQNVTVTQPTELKAPLPLTFVGWINITKWIGPSAHGYGVYLQIVDPAKPTVIVASAHADIDEKTPRDRWHRLEVTVEAPADGIAYQAQVRFYPPAGTALWTRCGLYPGDQLGFFDVDQALIIKGHVEHAQDTSLGKGDLLIGTRCQPTGITRTRTYPYDERMPIDTAIREIASLYRGPEVTLEVTATAQTVVTHHPRQGVATMEILVHGGDIVAYDAATDTRDAASSIIMQADGSGADREEGYASDPAALDGLMLERVISTEDETPVTELEEGAVDALARFKQPRPAVWVTIDPRRVSSVLTRISQGDTARLVITEAGIDGTHRFVKRRIGLDDTLQLMFTPEA